MREKTRALFASVQNRCAEALPHIELGAGVLPLAAEWTAARYQHVLLVADPNTRKAAGDAFAESLRAAGVESRVFCYPAAPLPDEKAVGALFCACGDEELVFAVGSGTIGDICKYVCARLGKPFAVVGTAPSMDGYASAGAAMLFGGLKVTPRAALPLAIFCDTEILRAAPLPMIASGLGDLLGKYTALADWKLAALFGLEHYDEEIGAWVEDALRRCVASAIGAARREAEAIETLTEGLLLTGLAMSVHGDSRPASGTEHHLAHFWEMRGHFAEHDKPGADISPLASHGTMVGVGTICALKLWAELSSIEPAFFGEELPEAERGACIRAQYRAAAAPLLETKNPRLSPEQIAGHWEEILAIAGALPKPEQITDLISLAGGAVTPAEAGIDPLTLRDGIVWARERKKTMTLLQLLGNLGRLEDFAARLRPGADVLRGVRCFVLDLDGTVYLSGKVFPFTLPFLEKLRQKDIGVLFFTNNSSDSAANYTKKLRDLGLITREEQLLTSTQVLLSHLEEHAPGKRVFIAGTNALKDEFAARGFVHTENTPDFAVLGFDKSLDYGVLTRLCDCARQGLPVYGVNMDWNCPVEGGYIPDCGSMAAALTAATGVQPPFFGKPSRHTLDFILRHTGLPEEALCFVGDRVYTDIAVTRDSRASSVLVLSGEGRLEDLQGLRTQPDLVLRDLGELGDLLEYL